MSSQFNFFLISQILLPLKENIWIKIFNKMVKDYQNPGTELRLKDRFNGCGEEKADSDA